MLGFSRDDKIRTCDHTPPRRVLYRAELHPAFFYIAVLTKRKPA